MKQRGRAIVSLAALLLLWELTARLGPWPRYLLPRPEEAALRLGELVRDGRLLSADGRSARRLGAGYGLSIVIGVLLGTASASWQRLHDVVSPLVLGLQALPSICWLPLALLWFGLGEAAILFVVLMGSVLAIAISTEGAVRAVPPLYVRAARTLGARRLRLYARVILPAALPGIVTGLRLGWTFAWRSLMAGELLHVAGGLGQLLVLGQELNDMALVIAVMAVIVAIGLVFDRLAFSWIEEHVRDRWGYG
jgi:NitT/TauT family transport system permease protein